MSATPRRRMLMLVLVSLVCGMSALASRVRAQALVSIAPRAGEVRLSGTLTAINQAQGRCVLMTTRVHMPDGTDQVLPVIKKKSIVLNPGTTYATVSTDEIRSPVLFDEIAALKPNMSALVIGKNGPNGVFIARLVCIISLITQPPIEEETREPSEPPGKNLLLPTDAVDNWGWMVIEPAKATIEREEGVIKVTVTEKGKEDWRIQLSQSVAYPEPGVSYTLSFRARAETARRMRVSAQVLESDFHDIGINRVATIGPEWKQYEYTFVARNLGAKGHIMPVFFFGTETGTTWLADVTLSVSYAEKRGNMLEAVSNPDAWKLSPLTKEGIATLNIMGERLEISTSAVGKQKMEPAYHLLPASPAPLQPGRSYSLTFRGRSGDERTLRVRGIADPVKLGPEEKPYEIRFQVKRLADFGLCPTFLLGEQLGTFTLRNVVLREERGEKKP